VSQVPDREAAARRTRRRPAGTVPQSPESQDSAAAAAPPPQSAESVQGDRLLDPLQAADDTGDDLSLRPRTLADYVGQERIKSNLKVFIRAALERREPLDHVLLYGPPGLGKTTIANILAHELQAPLRSTSGPAIERAGDLAAILTNLEAGALLFIDEIHRLQPILEEILYQAMEDYQIDIVIGQGPAARTVKLELPRFTLVGATTRIGLLTGPLRDRFGIVHHLDFYPVEDLVRIVRRAARILGISVEQTGAEEIGRRSRGTPRIANRLLRRVRDFAQVEADGRIDGVVAAAYLERLEVDRFGLDQLDRRILMTIHEKFDGGPVGLNTIAAALGEERDTIEEIYEPYLMQIGFLDRTSRGRRITPRALEHLHGIRQQGDQRRLWD